MMDAIFMTPLICEIFNTRQFGSLIIQKWKDPIDNSDENMKLRNRYQIKKVSVIQQLNKSIFPQFSKYCASDRNFSLKLWHCVSSFCFLQISIIWEISWMRIWLSSNICSTFQSLYHTFSFAKFTYSLEI